MWIQRTGGGGIRRNIWWPAGAWSCSAERAAERTLRLLYSLTIGCSSVLLFSVQPIMAKALLPRFGGSAGVWVTCMLFFQVMLLLGYLYSYLITACLTRR